MEQWILIPLANTLVASLVCLLWFLGVLHQEDESKTDPCGNNEATEEGKKASKIPDVSKCDMKILTKDQNLRHLYLMTDSTKEQVLLQVQRQRQRQSTMPVIKEEVQETEMAQKTETESERKIVTVTGMAPVLEMAPVTEMTPVTKMAMVTEMAPSTEIAPVIEIVPVKEMLPVTEMASVTEMTPVADLAPVKEMVLVTEMAKVTELAPVVVDMTKKTQMVTKTKIAKENERFQWPRQSGLVEQVRKACSPIHSDLEETLKECGILRRMIGEEEEEVEEGRVEEKARMSGNLLDRKQVRVYFDKFLANSRPGLGSGDEETKENPKPKKNKNKNKKVDKEGELTKSRNWHQDKENKNIRTSGWNNPAWKTNCDNIVKPSLGPRIVKVF